MLTIDIVPQTASRNHRIAVYLPLRYLLAYFDGVWCLSQTI